MDLQFHLTAQIGILSLANQNLVLGLAISDVALFIHLYLSVPVWALLFVPVLWLHFLFISYFSSNRSSSSENKFFFRARARK